MEVALGEAAVGIMFGDDALTTADQGIQLRWYIRKMEQDMKLPEWQF